MLGDRLPGTAEECVQALKPAGRHGRGAVTAQWARKDDVRRGAGGHHPVMCHLADHLLRGGQFGGGAHGSAHPRAGVSGSRPDTLGESA